MYILSCFITSNKVFILVYKNGVYSNYDFSFYPSFQGKEDLEFLLKSLLKNLKISASDCLFLFSSTFYSYNLLDKPTVSLNELISKDKDYLYIYFDNLTLISQKNLSCASLGLSKRSDNFLSNRSVFQSKVFNNDLEEVVYFSKSLNDTISSSKKKVILGGDYFTDTSIPNEFKINFISEILSSGFYEIYIDYLNEYPHFASLNIHTNIGYKKPKFEPFIYLISSEKDSELLFENRSTNKYLSLKKDETMFIHTDEDKNNIKSSPLLKYKGRELGKGEVLIDTSFGGLFIDRRSYKNKKENFGVESLRQVLNSIEKSHDYSNL